MTAAEFYEKHARWIWTVGILGVAGTLAVGLVVAPYDFWDRYLWEDIWGPTVTDAEGWAGGCWGPDGAHAANRIADPTAPGRVRTTCPPGEILAIDGYTPASEVTYGVLLAAILYGIYRGLIRRGRIDTDGWFILGLLPFIVFGPVVRVLEDAGVFRKATGFGAGAFSYFFISPWLYMQIGIYAAAALALGVFLRDRRAKTSLGERTTIVASAVVLVAAVQSFVVNGFAAEFQIVPEAAWTWAAAAVGIAAYVLVDRSGGRVIPATTFAIGLPVLGPAAGLVWRWSTNPWVTDPGYHFKVAGFVLLFSTAITLAVWIGAIALRGTFRQAAAFALGINLAIVFAHMLDGFATFLTLCSQPVDTVCTGASFLNLGLGGYGEKHPLSAFLLQLGNGWGFPAAKLLMVGLVVYLLDKESREGNEGDRALVGLIQLAIFALGFGPGLRDLLLVTFNFGLG